MQNKSLTAAVKFQPRRAQSPCGKTPAQVKAHLATIGVIFTTGADDFGVRLKSQNREDAYRTDDLGDALATGIVMAAE